ncbi:MAG: hypothetical protein WCP16_21800 [Pseudanabaena sp. ELA645]
MAILAIIAPLKINQPAIAYPSPQIAIAYRSNYSAQIFTDC